MSTKSYQGSQLFLQRMVDACEKIRAYLRNTSEREFLEKKESYDAICLQLSQLGEQVGHLEKSTERIIQHFPDDVQWAALKAIRNRVDHSYTSIDPNLIWAFASEQTEEVELNLRRILKKRFGIEK